MRDGWRTTVLGDVVEVTIGRQRSPKHATGDDLVPYLRAANVKDGRIDIGGVLEMNFTPAEQVVFALRAGDVLVTEGCGSLRELGASARWQGEIPGVVCFQNTLLRLRSIGDVTDPLFVEIWARHAHHSGLFARVASGTNIFHIGATRAKQIPILLPSIEDQRRIVDVAAALEVYELALRALERRTRSSQQPLLADSAGSFTMVPLAEVVEVAKAGGTPSRSHPEFFGGPIPWLKSGEVAQDPIDSTEESISQAGLDASSAWVVTAGAVVVAMYGATAGEVGRTAVPLATNQAVLALLPREGVDSSYLFHWLRGRTNEMKARATGAAQPNLSKARVLEEEIPSAPLDIQRQIGEILDATSDVAREASRAVVATQRLRGRILAELLAGDAEIPSTYDDLLAEVS